MSTQFTQIGLAAFLSAAVLAGPALAQQAAPAAGPTPAAPAGQPQNPNGPVKIQMQTYDKTNWVKVCPKVQPGAKEFCMTTRDFTTAQDQPPPVALAIYDVKGDDSRLMRIRGVRRSHPDLAGPRMEMCRYSLQALTQETGVTAVDVQNRMTDFGIDAF